MDELIEESILLWHTQWLDFIKFCKENYFNISINELIERYEKQFNIVQKWL